VILYAPGVFPSLTGALNATPCWTGKKPCSWNPWGQINATVNGGVPQVADLVAHVRQLEHDVEISVPLTNFSGLLIVDWEAWRPLAQENDDALSLYTEYSARLVRAQYPQWSNATRIHAEAVLQFNAGARAFFSVTVETLRRLRPHARIGFYSQGIDSSSANDAALTWLWEAVDILAPSIYPHGQDAMTLARATNSTVSEAIRVAERIGRMRHAVGDPRPPPAVYPYARCLVQDSKPLSRSELASGIQIAAGLGAEGLVLWGSTSDYTCAPDGCALVGNTLDTVAGPLISKCVANRQACSAASCNGNGRCVDYAEERLLETCISSAPPDAVRCRCDVGFAGDRCNETVQSR
jgi:hyaluronoglucosaminidase